MSTKHGPGLRLRWIVRQRGGVNKEMTQRSQFDSEQGVELPEALVREAGQNSIDAADSAYQGPVRMRIATIRPEKDDAAYLANLLGPLLPHLDACNVPVDALNFSQPTLLVIEDFGTTGLTGHWGDDDAIGGWYDFFRNFGASHKTGSRGGRWGLGKLVFTSVSLAKSFFALTVRRGDEPRQPLLMGQAVLRAHSIGNTKYDSHGFFARPHEAGEFQLPVQDPDELARFVRACGVERKLEPGLSIVIPFPQMSAQPEGTSQDLVQYLLANFFFPILSGRFVAEVDGIEVSEATYDDLVERRGGNSLHAGRLARFIRELNVQKEREPHVVFQDGWVKDIGAAVKQDTLERLRSKFAEGDLIHARFPVPVRRRGGAARATSVDVFMRRTKPEEKSASVCARGMLTVPREARNFSIEGCFIALVAWDDGEDGIVSFLGDAEGPAHTEWNAHESKVKENWYNPSARLREVRLAPRLLHTLLASVEKQTEEDALIDDFWLPRELRPPSPPPSPGPGNPPVSPEGQLSRFNITRRDGRFVVTAGPGLGIEDLPMRLRVRLAYDVLRGDPFKKHSRFDFDLLESDEIEVDLKDCSVASVNPKTIVLEAASAEFKAAFTGFDTKRDLVIDARRVPR
jgi:hypothetical protein